MVIWHPIRPSRAASQELIASVHDIPGLSSATSERLTQSAWHISNGRGRATLWRNRWVNLNHGL